MAAAPAASHANPQSFRRSEVWLLIVLSLFFDFMSVCPRGGWCAVRPVCPGAHRLRPRRGGPPSCRWGCSCWSGGCWQGAEPLPAGEERVFPWPAGADGEGALPGVAGQAGGQVPDPVAEGVGVGVAEVAVVAVRGGGSMP